jgi:hypothetical protein
VNRSFHGPTNHHAMPWTSASFLFRRRKERRGRSIRSTDVRRLHRWVLTCTRMRCPPVRVARTGGHTHRMDDRKVHVILQSIPRQVQCAMQGDSYLHSIVHGEMLPGKHTFFVDTSLRFYRIQVYLLRIRLESILQSRRLRENTLHSAFIFRSHSILATRESRPIVDGRVQTSIQ